MSKLTRVEFNQVQSRRRGLTLVGLGFFFLVLFSCWFGQDKANEKDFQSALSVSQKLQKQTVTTNQAIDDASAGLVR